MDTDGLPLKIQVVPGQAGQFIAARTSQQQGAQIGGNGRVMDAAHGFEPRVQHFALQHVILLCANGRGKLAHGFCGAGVGMGGAGIFLVFSAPADEGAKGAVGLRGLAWPAFGFFLKPCAHGVGIQGGKLQRQQGEYRAGHGGSGFARAAASCARLATLFCKCFMVRQVAGAPLCFAGLKVGAPGFAHGCNQAAGFLALGLAGGDALLFLFARVGALVNQ